MIDIILMNKYVMILVVLFVSVVGVIVMVKALDWANKTNIGENNHEDNSET